MVNLFSFVVLSSSRWHVGSVDEVIGWFSHARVLTAYETFKLQVKFTDSCNLANRCEMPWKNHEWMFQCHDKWFKWTSNEWNMTQQPLMKNETWLSKMKMIILSITIASLFHFNLSPIISVRNYLRNPKLNTCVEVCRKDKWTTSNPKCDAVFDSTRAFVDIEPSHRWLTTETCVLKFVYNYRCDIFVMRCGILN